VDAESPSLLAELRRRRVFRALVGYGLAAFAVLQIIEPVMHGLHWPDTVLTYVVVALAIGFPLTVCLAWIFDINAGRIERTPATQKPYPRLALWLVGIGILAAAPAIVWYFFRSPGKPSPEAVGPSIAVLPFVNLSSDKEQEYFSDGVAEEILNALTQIEGLRVIGRTSSFSFKGKSEDLHTIGEKLQVGHLLEGSVRKAGNRVWVTARLVEAAGGTQLWSQVFEPEQNDIFAVQDEIARAVRRRLRSSCSQAAPVRPRSCAPSTLRPMSSIFWESSFTRRSAWTHCAGRARHTTERWRSIQSMPPRGQAWRPTPSVWPIIPRPPLPRWKRSESARLSMRRKPSHSLRTPQMATLHAAHCAPNLVSILPAASGIWNARWS
jgi:TolB-like protein